jgi:hypothetical protein
MQTFNESRIYLKQRWFLVALGTLLLCLGVSGVSLWIDEGYSAKLAAQPTFADWIATLSGIRGSEPQMPGYQLYLWFWARLFGTSEWALRLANVPWAVLFAASLAWGAECLLNIRKAWLIICLSPFLWFYMNEARPYAMVMGLAMVTTVAVLAYARNAQRFGLAPWWCLVSLLLLWSSHMLAIILAPSLLLLLCVMRPASIKIFIRQWLFPAVITLPCYFCLAFYYLRTLVSGKGGVIERPSLPNLVFAMYEFLGFGGLGPPRNLLRQSPNFHTLLLYWPGIGLGVLALGIVALAILLNLRESAERRVVFALFVAFTTGLLFTFALSYAAHFRMLGRHIAAFFPLLVLLLLTGLQKEGNLPRIKLASCVLLLGIAWSVSDFRQRLLQSYEKDDYRDAAALAHNALARGEPVLWLADQETAEYYGLRTTEVLKPVSTATPGRMAAASGGCPFSWFQQSLQDHLAVLVVMSDKPDLFDIGGKCRKTLDSLNSVHVASFPAFEAWQVTGVKISAERF